MDPFGECGGFVSDDAFADAQPFGSGVLAPPGDHLVLGDAEQFGGCGFGQERVTEVDHWLPSNVIVGVCMVVLLVV